MAARARLHSSSETLGASVNNGRRSNRCTGITRPCAARGGARPSLPIHTPVCARGCARVVGAQRWAGRHDARGGRRQEASWLRVTPGFSSTARPRARKHDTSRWLSQSGRSRELSPESPGCWAESRTTPAVQLWAPAAYAPSRPCRSAPTTGENRSWDDGQDTKAREWDQRGSTERRLDAEAVLGVARTKTEVRELARENRIETARTRPLCVCCCRCDPSSEVVRARGLIRACGAACRQLCRTAGLRAETRRGELRSWPSRH